MKKSFAALTTLISIVLFFGFYFFSCYAAEIGYVSDYFKITLRAGPGTNYKILAFLSSGEPLEIISKQGNWIKVRPLNSKYKNKEGWVLSRFIIKRKPYKKVADELIEKNAQLKEKLLQLKNELDNVVKSQKELSQQLNSTIKAYQEIKQKYDSLKRECTSFLVLKRKYKNNMKELNKLKLELNKIKKENEELKRSQAHRWFAMGAFVLFSGIVLGFIFGRQKKKRSIYYS